MTKHTITTNKTNGTWIFTDLARGLVDEPFSESAGDIIERLRGWFMTRTEYRPEDGLLLTFSDSALELPDGAPLGLCDDEDIVAAAPDLGANYYSPWLDAIGWLCPALLRYFPSPPPWLYVRIQPGIRHNLTSS